MGKSAHFLQFDIHLLQSSLTSLQFLLQIRHLYELFIYFISFSRRTLAESKLPSTLPSNGIAAAQNHLGAMHPTFKFKPTLYFLTRSDEKNNRIPRLPFHQKSVQQHKTQIWPKQQIFEEPTSANYSITLTVEWNSFIDSSRCSNCSCISRSRFCKKIDYGELQ